MAVQSERHVNVDILAMNKDFNHYSHRKVYLKSPHLYMFLYLMLMMIHHVACLFPVLQDARSVGIREAGTREVAEADGEEERGAGLSEEPEGEAAGGDVGGGEDHR